MKLLHIAYLDETLGGVNAIVPQHVNEEGRYAETALYNVYARSADEIRSFDLENTEIGRPDLIVFHEVYRPQYIALYKKAVSANIPYVIVPHGSLTKTSQHKKFFKKFLGNVLLFNGFIEHARAVHCLSGNEYEQTSVKPEKFISSNGISAAGTKSSFRTAGLRLVYIGRLEIGIKGIDLMLSAVELVKKDLASVEARLDIFGPDDGDCHKKIQAMIDSYGLGDLVELHPPVTGEDKTAELLDADVFIQTSRTEGMSVGLLEALASGLPVIVSEGTGMGSFVTE